MNLQIPYLMMVLLGSTASPPDTLPPIESQRTTLNEIVSAIQEAPVIETFLVACGEIRVTRETAAASYDSIPKIGYCPVLARNLPLDHALRSTLATLVQRAARDSCGVARGCMFDGRFAFRFKDRVPPLDLVISNECTSWIFLRGSTIVTFEAGLTGYTDCISGSLRRLLTVAFEEMDRSFKATWPLLMDR